MKNLILINARYCAVVFLILTSLGRFVSAETTNEQLMAFPNAVGQGALSTGGRGGDVYHVDNLFDYGDSDSPIAGSLRHGIESAVGPRTIVFNTSGAIELTRPLDIATSQLTIAGQTAPEGGITLYGYPTQIRDASDVVIRYLRFRTGDFNAMAMDSDRTPLPGQGNGREDLVGDQADALSILPNVNRIIVDHVSTSWSMDETLSISNGASTSGNWRNITVQNSIIGPSLHDSFHHKGPHGLGSLNQGDLSAAEEAAGTGGYTHYGNLWVHQNKRTPSFGGQQQLRPDQPEEERGAVNMNVVNSVVYNWGIDPANRVPFGGARVNFIGNYMIAGQNTEDPNRVMHELGEGKTFVYQQGNYLDANLDSQHDGISLDASPEATEFAFVDFEPGEVTSSNDSTPFNFADSVDSAVVSAPLAYDRVVAEVGASIFRDSVDQQIITELESRTGGFLNSQEQLRDDNGILPGIDDISSVQRPEYFDTDRDGIPNYFERAFGLDWLFTNDSGGYTINDTGYTNLEVYLHSLTVKEIGADLNLDGQIDENDWQQFQRRFGGDLLSHSISTVQGQILADTSMDGIYTEDDLIGFAAAYDEANGAGSFAQLSSVPEPSSRMIMLGCLVLAVSATRNSRNR